MAKGEPAERKILHRAVAAVAAAHPKRKHCGILVVESDPNVQWQLARMLTVQGNRVVGTSSGDGALALISRWPVDLVLIDEDLPGMDGFEVAKKIRQGHPDIPVVLMGAEEHPDMHVAARLAGAVTVLIKPFRLETLSELLASLQLPHLTPAE